MQYDVIIIGGGPAGLTAAIYGLRAGKKVLVLEAKAIGGQIINAQNIANYPGVLKISGRELSKNMKEQVKILGGQIKLEKAMRLEVEGAWKAVKTDLDNCYMAPKIIIAAGAENRKLGIEHEDEWIGKGISYCATCDGHFFKGKVVAVVGGGNTALVDAIYLSDLAKKVYLIHRRDGFSAEKIYVDEARRKNNIEFLLNTRITGLCGSENLRAIEMGEKKLDVNALFVAVGYRPASDIFRDVLEIDEDSYIETCDGIHTNLPGVYVAGDIRRKNLRQLITAMSDGANAMMLAIQE